MRIELTGKKQSEGESVGTEIVAPLWSESKTIQASHPLSKSTSPKKKGESSEEKKSG